MRWFAYIFVLIQLLTVGCQHDYEDDLQSFDSGTIAVDIFVGAGSQQSRSLDVDDDTFSDIALYVFNSAGKLEQVYIKPYLTPEITQQITLELSSGLKRIYIFANYSDKQLVQSDGAEYTLSEQATEAEINDLVTQIDSEFDPESLLMVGYKELSISTTSAGSVVEIELRRLVSRVDLLVYKGESFGDQSVVLESVKLVNRVLSSEVLFDYSVDGSQMVEPSVYGSAEQVVGRELSTLADESASDGGCDPFYSYQSLVGSLERDQVATLEFTISYNGTTHSYWAYVADDSQSDGRYSLLQNYLYQVTAVADSESLQFNVEVCDWDTKEILFETTDIYYLYLSEDVIRMVNIDSYTIGYLANDTIEIEDVEATTTEYDLSGESYLVEYNTRDSQYPQFVIDSATGSITINSAVPINYSVKHISFTVVSSKGLSLDVDIMHYPAIYLTARPSTGNVKPEYYSGGSNLNFYTINTLLPCEYGSYFLGDPTFGTSYTDSGEEANNLVSPQFIIASQYGIYPTVNYDEAQQRCYDYGEDIYRSGWRLPTKAEMIIIDRVQSDENSAFSQLLSGSAYWTAYKWAYYNFDQSRVVESSSSGSAYVRGVYDLYKYEGEGYE